MTNWAVQAHLSKTLRLVAVVLVIASTTALAATAPKLQSSFNVRSSLPKGAYCDPLDIQFLSNDRLLIDASERPCSNDPTVSRTAHSVLVVVDLQGKPLASTRLNGDVLPIAGPDGTVLIQNLPENSEIQMLGPSLDLLRSIPCTKSGCRVFLSADHTGFAVCSVSLTQHDCRFYRGAGAMVAEEKDFPGGFPELRSFSPQTAVEESKRYFVQTGEVWTLDIRGNVTIHLQQGNDFQIANPEPPRSANNCDGQVSAYPAKRFLADCTGGIGSWEMPLFWQTELTVYDVESRKAIAAFKPTGPNSILDVRLSFDGKHIGVFRGFSRSKISIYELP